MSDLILTHQHDTVFEIVLNRPEKRNAINMEMFRAFDTAVATANRTPGLRAVLIRGEGKVFSAGIDVSALLGLAQTYGPHWQTRMRAITDEFQGILTRLERLEVPTIALLHGYCLGLSMELALACDMRIAAAGTKLGLPETLLGIIPDVGGTTRLARLAGVARAKELIFTGRHIDAAQAEQWGLLNYVVSAEELETKAAKLVEEISQAAPLAVGMAKRVIDGLADVDRGLMLEGWAQSQLFSSEDFMEGAQAFMMKRPPQWKGK
ncbi:MAG: enoyl-CoA hydratase/isomerase family protein [Ardenticatenaceae bacterium]|nr:enoyl-CoA hydratase/isomerase family protein [Anaerolineales bacterium]MCB8922398.1 enoyl-CoA hydratase/isomerase family protein [Ardenticatenaceae bacterium]MCB8991330.1 enoyl-CoA hydratase/isomerase family protein [Ardenticatenaceae bacterium]